MQLKVMGSAGSNSKSARNNNQHWKSDKLQAFELNISGSCYSHPPLLT